MSTLKFQLNDYVAYIFTSSRKRLLVEGPDDNRLFTRLLRAVEKDRRQVDIDDASSLIGFSEPLGNREKVELVCSTIKSLSHAEKLVGFVDREFRGFSWEPNLDDAIMGHRVDGRLVWSRGHSIENYYFDFQTLRDPIITLSTTPYCDTAIDMMESNFEKVIRLACAASLTGMEVGNIHAIRSAIVWDIFELLDSEIYINIPSLEFSMRTRRISAQIIEQVIARYPYWQNLIFDADFDLVRWMCHGHMGLTYIWASFQRMVYEKSKADGNERPERDVAHSIEARDDIRFNACAGRWIERCLGNEDAFPFEVLRMLNVVN